MQTAKSFLTLLVLGLCVVSYSQTRPDTEAQAKAREALRKKIAELNAQGTTAPAAPASAPPSAPSSVFVDPATLSSGTAPATPEQIERQRESTRKKIAELNAQPQVAAKPQAEAKPVPTAFPPIPAPPSSVPASKEARLADLLKKYKADEITPEQYHTDRAKILAEP